MLNSVGSHRNFAETEYNPTGRKELGSDLALIADSIVLYSRLYVSRMKFPGGFASP